MSFELLHTVKTSYDNECYILDGCVCSNDVNHNSQALLALSTSNHTIRLYDVHSATFVCSINDHTAQITDLISNSHTSASSLTHDNCLFSSQSDGGVMMSDVRVGRGVHFLHCNQDAPRISANISGVCNSVALAPSSQVLAVSLGSEVVFYDTRMWTIMSGTSQLHNDDVTRIRFINDTTLCSSSEDQMIVFTNVSSYANNTFGSRSVDNNNDNDNDDDDNLLQAISVGEVMTKMSCFDDLQCVAMIGTCENGYVCPYNLEAREQKINRPNEFTYLVDWCTLQTPHYSRVQESSSSSLSCLQPEWLKEQHSNNKAKNKVTSLESELLLVMGIRDEEGNAGALQVMNYATGMITQLPRVHSEIARVAVGFNDRLITGAEDGMLAFWKYTNQELSLSSSSCLSSSTMNQCSLAQPLPSIALSPIGQPSMLSTFSGQREQEEQHYEQQHHQRTSELGNNVTKERVRASFMLKNEKQQHQQQEHSHKSYNKLKSQSNSIFRQSNSNTNSYTRKKSKKGNNNDN